MLNRPVSPPRSCLHLVPRLVLLLLMVTSHAYGQTAQERIDRKIPLDPDGSLRIYNMTGSVRVEAWDRDTVAVTGTKSGGSSTRFFIGGSRRGAKFGIEGPLEIDQPPAHLVVRVPARARVWIKSATANVTLTGLRGGADVFSTSGNIHFEGSPDQLNLETMDGNIEIEADGAWIRAKTASGTIVFRGSGEDAAASTVSGNITLLSGGMRRARAETVSGDIGFAGALTRDGSLMIESHSGRVDVLLPADLSAQFDVSSYHGSIRNDFAPENAPSHQPSGEELHFTAGAGGAGVNIKTFKGSIILRKK